MTALHNFEYEEANEAFRQARAIDPGFALAYWGEAMTYYQVLWRNENVDAARRALAGLAPTASARAAKAGSARDKGLLAAAEILFGEGDATTRHTRYAEAMGGLSATHPDDPDVASLYALALMGTVSRSLIGYSDAHDLHQPGLAGSDVQQRVAAILDRVLASHPQHPGALHYLLHAYDDPEHARLGLSAARAYAKVAGGSSHALHMPAHMFLQLGLWSEAATSDRAAWAASNEWVTRKSLGPAMRNYHALSWLQYELLQMGRYREAWELIGQIEPVVKASGALSRTGASSSPQPLLSDLSSMRARFVIETRRWSMLGRESNFGNVDELLAIGMSAASTSNPELAEMARGALAQRAQSEQEGDLRPAIAIMEREVAALIARAGGRGNEAIAILETATRAELALPAPLGLPSPPKPAPELLGEVLLEAGRPREAQASFEQALGRNASRSLSVLGVARAAMALGDTGLARQRYRELLANFEAVDEDLPEVKEARVALEQPNAVRDGNRFRWAVGLIVSALAMATFYVVLRASRTRAKTDRNRRTTRAPLKKKATKARKHET
jgi:tetratricopeptide (TPR) repeat protein